MGLFSRLFGNTSTHKGGLSIINGIKPKLIGLDSIPIGKKYLSQTEKEELIKYATSKKGSIVFDENFYAFQTMKIEGSEKYYYFTFLDFIPANYEAVFKNNSLVKFTVIFRNGTREDVSKPEHLKGLEQSLIEILNNHHKE